MNCNETFLNEVTHVELIPASACTIPVPPMANSVTELSGCTFGTAAMVIDINDNDNYAGTMDSAPTLKTTEKAETLLYEMGFRDCRIRMCGENALVQVTAAQYGEAMARRNDIAAALGTMYGEVIIDDITR